jgi:hypothetical protein
MYSVFMPPDFTRRWRNLLAKSYNALRYFLDNGSLSFADIRLLNNSKELTRLEKL